jgi:hypothetical protein
VYERQVEFAVPPLLKYHANSNRPRQILAMHLFDHMSSKDNNHDDDNDDNNYRSVALLLEGFLFFGLLVCCVLSVCLLVWKVY